MSSSSVRLANLYFISSSTHQQPHVTVYRHCRVMHSTMLTSCYSTHTHTRLTALCPGLPGWAGTRKVKPVWILLKQEIVSGSGISWATCKSAPRSRHITTPAPYHSIFYRPDALPAAQPTASKHWRVYSCYSTDNKRPYCCRQRLNDYFGSCRIFPILHNAPSLQCFDAVGWAAGRASGL